MLAASAMVCLMGLAPVSARADDGPNRARIVHLRVKGDLDCMRLSTELGAQVARAKQEATDVLLVEMDGNRWRGDVLLSMARALGEEARGSMKLWVLLGDAADQRVGSGQAALGVLADRCYVQARTGVCYTPGDDLRALAGADTDFAQIETEMRSALWSAARAKGLDGLLSALLPAPGQSLWLVAGPEGKLDKVSAGAPMEGQRSIPLTGTDSPLMGKPCVGLKLSAESTVLCGAACGSVRDVGELLAAERFSPAPLVRREIQSGLAEAGQSLVAGLADVDRLSRRIDKALDEAERTRGYDAERKKRGAGRECAAGLKGPEDKLRAAEALLTDFPELLKSPPPGTTTVELSPQRLSQAWFKAMQDRRDELAALRARSARLIE